ncbi:MAG: response regulator, partial [Byssovorax sp.]
MSSTGAIMIVDDSEAELALTMRALKKSGIKLDVTLAHSGTEALDLLHRNDNGEAGRPNELPGIVLLDLKMPGVDGMTVLRRIRADERTRCLPVIILSSSNEVSDVGACFQIGANSYIRKSVDFADFTETMRVLRQYWDINELPPAPLGV